MGEIEVGCVVWRCERREELVEDITIFDLFLTGLLQESTASIRSRYS